MSDLPVPDHRLATAPVPVASPSPPAPQTLVCGNCQASLAGEYCAACGQRHEPHVHSLGHFAGEAFESLSHADSRLWRTLMYLLFKPGYLTREFFDGRRVRYLPPFRLYLVISVVFFLVVGAGSEGPSVEIERPKSAADAAALNQVADELEKRSLDKNGEAVGKIAEQLRALAKAQGEQLPPSGATRGAEKPTATAPLVAQPSPLPGPTDASAATAPESDDVTLSISTGDEVEGGVNQFCEQFAADVAPSEAKDNTRRESVLRWCGRFNGRGVEAIGAALAHNIPRAMFIFLPLLALCMKLMYWRPRRYYVEHLLFMVHNHAFVFLTASIVMLVGMIPMVGDYAWPLYWAAFFYMAWYIYRAMRNVYGQSRGLTALKYFALGFNYLIAAFVVFLLTFIYSTLTF